MTLKLLIDASIGRTPERWLKQSDYDVAVVRDVDPNMLDHDILTWAVEEERIVVTMDKDFGELVYKESLRHTGVLLLRLESETSQNKIKVLEHILSDVGERLSGSYSVYRRGQVRIHS